jgi:hypothetical protein
MPSSSQNQTHSITDMAVQTAVQLHRRGLRPVPVWGITPEGKCACGNADCSAQGKHPVGKGWQNAKFDSEDDVRNAFAGVGSDHLNVGVKFGLQQDGSWLLDVEADSPAAQKFMEESGLLDIPTVQWTSARGTHTLWRISNPQDFDPPTATFKREDDLEFRTGTRTDKGCQSVIAGSFHKSGVPVRFVGDQSPEFTGVAECPQQLREIIDGMMSSTKSSPRTDITELVAADITDGKRNATLVQVAGSLVSRIKVNAWNRAECGKLVGTLLASVNAAHCKPPLPASELQQIVATAIGPWFDKAIKEKKKELVRITDLGVRESAEGGYEIDGDDGMYVVEVDLWGDREYRIVCQGGYEVTIPSDVYWFNADGVRRAFVKAIPRFKPPTAKEWETAWLGHKKGTHQWDGLCDRLVEHSGSRHEQSRSCPWVAAAAAIVEQLMDAGDPPTSHHQVDGSPILLDEGIAFMPATVRSMVKQQSAGEYTTQEVDVAWNELTKIFRSSFMAKEIEFGDDGSLELFVVSEDSLVSIEAFVREVSF